MSTKKPCLYLATAGIDKFSNNKDRAAGLAQLVADTPVLLSYSLDYFKDKLLRVG